MNTEFTADEMMTIAAARLLTSDDVCFVGIGPPSAACNMARLTHAPGITLIYESGTIGTAPTDCVLRKHTVQVGFSELWVCTIWRSTAFSWFY